MNIPGELEKAVNKWRDAEPSLEWDKFDLLWAKDQKIQTVTDLRSAIEHTLLKPDASKLDVERLCKEAIEFKVLGVCVNPCRIELCKSMLKGMGIKIVTVISFPLGAAQAGVKAAETAAAVEAGADEIDTVINRGLLKDNDFKNLVEDIAAVCRAAGDKPVKVILESAELTKEEKITACLASTLAGAAFVKTSTGFGRGGASIEDVKLMRSCVPPSMGVKASGGIRDKKTAMAMLSAGANRIGTSSTPKILGEE